VSAHLALLIKSGVRFLDKEAVGLPRPTELPQVPTAHRATDRALENLVDFTEIDVDLVDQPDQSRSPDATHRSVSVMVCSPSRFEATCCGRPFIAEDRSISSSR
jgi:hypothetical protein